MLLHIATKLRLIHAAGYAHRDVKPGNVILESKTKQWILIDYASSARIGELACITYTLRYAPPELAASLEAGAQMVEVSGAIDVWALGIMAWTLLTASDPFADKSKAEVRRSDMQCFFRSRTIGQITPKIIYFH